MGGSSFTDYTYSRSVKKYTESDRGITTGAEQKAKLSGALNPLVDPSTDGGIRQSKARFEPDVDSDLWRLIDMPMAMEMRLDTTGSMGDNVDKALTALPNLYGLCSKVLPDYELQISIGIFGDIVDTFPLCRPQFASSAERLVERLTLLVPERDGGDLPEDPHYGLFGAAYLTDARIDKYGLKHYDFTVSDAPARNEVICSQLIRIFGEEVFEKTKENGYELNPRDLPDTREIVRDLLTRAHAFFLQVGYSEEAYRFWKNVFGRERVVRLVDTEHLPHTQAVIVGLTEGSLSLSSASAFLAVNGVAKTTAEAIVQSVAHIPLGEQAELLSKLEKPLPRKGDLFRNRLDVWPISTDTTSSDPGTERDKKDPDDNSFEWL